MNISSKIFPNGSNFSDYLFYNDSLLEDSFAMTSLLDIIIIMFDLPTNFYVMWLIVTGTGNGLASEFFSLNLSVSEIILCMESLLSNFMYKFEIILIFVAFLDGQATTGRPLFQCLICVERYLAVVHPVTFLKFKPLRYRVICSVSVWVASFGSSGIIVILIMSQLMWYYVFLFTQLFLYLSIQLFCLVSVLRALKQSGPGERGREREEENHTKRRAFYLILITNVIMLTLYAPYLISVGLTSSATAPDVVPTICFIFFTLAGLVQPLLFLYRVRKLPFINYQ